MKASNLIKILEKHPDADIRVSVKDHYSHYGQDASVFDCNPDTDTIYSGYHFNKDANWFTIGVSLSTNEEGKKPKITYRS